MTLDNILEEIKKAETIVVLCHESPDGDAVASSLSVMHAVAKLGKEADVIIPEYSKVFDFLPGADKILQKGRTNKYDLAISVDCSDLKRLVGGKEYFETAKRTIEIDHHSVNSMFADFNYVDPVAPACCQVLIGMFEYFGIDIDKRDFEDAIMKDILSLFDITYAEKSPSGKGLHIIAKVDLIKIPKNKDGTKINEKYYQKNPHNKIECYIGELTNRFFTFTENVIVDKSINDCTEQLLTFLDTYMLKETKEKTVADSDIIDIACTDIIEIIKKSEQAEKFKKLYFEGDISDYDEDDSSADLALCDIFAFYCGEDTEIIDKLFCGSKLYREKWNRTDYKFNTIKKAISFCKGKFYKNGVNFKLLANLKK